MNNNIEFINDELFCLKQELETLSDVLLRSKSERWVPGYLLPDTEYSHLSRYELASQYVNGLEVLDIACGTGKGSFIMVKNGSAKSVLGCDIDSNAIRYAKHRYQIENIDFKVENAQCLPFENMFDVIVSFETIEHLSDYDSFLKSVKRALRPGGLFILSTPISDLDFDSKPKNPFHVQEWGFISFQKLISNYFKIRKVFVQLYPGAFIKKESKISKVINKLINMKSKEFHFNAKIEEFTNQYTEKYLRTKGCGYQIVILINDK